MTSGPVTATPVDVPAPAPAAPGTTEDDDVELDEFYLRSLQIDHLVALLDKNGVSIPDTVEMTSKAIVDYVVATYGE